MTLSQWGQDNRDDRAKGKKKVWRQFKITKWQTYTITASNTNISKKKNQIRFRERMNARCPLMPWIGIYLHLYSESKLRSQIIWGWKEKWLHDWTTKLKREERCSDTDKRPRRTAEVRRVDRCGKDGWRRRKKWRGRMTTKRDSDSLIHLKLELNYNAGITLPYTSCISPLSSINSLSTVCPIGTDISKHGSKTEYR